MRFAISSSRGLPNLNDHRKPTRVEYCDDEQIVFKFASPILNSQVATFDFEQLSEQRYLSPVQSLVACVCLSFVLPLRLYNNYEVPTIIYTHPIQPPAAEFLARFFFLVLSLVSCCVRSYKLLAPSRSQPQPGQPQQQLPCVIKQIQKYLATSIHSNGVSRGETFLDTLLGRWVWPSDAA